MSDKGSVFQKGGGGTNFEQYVQSAFIATLVVKGNAPCIPTNEIYEIAFQSTNNGWETDDILVLAKSNVADHKLLIQVKHNLVFSSDNLIFKEVITSFWKDFTKTSFDRTNDRLVIVKNRLNNIEKNQIKGVLNFAKTHSSEVDFLSEVNRIKEKQDRYLIFKDAIKEANSGIDASNQDIWEFLKCLDVLGYDFLNEGSVDETYFLNLIKLSKNTDSSSSERDVWNGILAFVSKANPNGGSITTSTLAKEEFYSKFDAKKILPNYSDIDKLRKDSLAILNPFKNKIGQLDIGCHIDRLEIVDSTNTAISVSSITIITGKPGAGKSALLKDILIKHYAFGTVFVFRADQFNVPHLSTVFANIGVHTPLQDLFSSISLVKEKLIVIDSLEKLLEGDPENAFKQLLGLVKDFPDVKIVCTSRKYAVELVLLKFGIERKDIQLVDVPPLVDSELNTVQAQFPILAGLMKSEKIRNLLQSPKYLDFALQSLGRDSNDLGNISITQFKEKLWSNLVENVTTKKGGLAGKRRKAFSNIAVKRAKLMSLFVEPDQGIDDEALESLEKDGIIFREGENYLFTPAHDILEDWALVKYIASKAQDYPEASTLFKNLGHEPAIRRAFRLWIEDYLVDDSAKIISLVKEIISDNTIERYWTDELLVAIFKSEDCSVFFKVFENELLLANGLFLNRCLHLTRTACKEAHSSEKSSFLLPIGSGWLHEISFLGSHLSKLDQVRPTVLNFIYDWEFRLLFDSPSKEEMESVKEITVFYIAQIENGVEFWDDDNMASKRKNLISLLLNLSPFAKKEITELVDRAFANEEKKDNWRLRHFYKEVINSVLSGIGNHKFCSVLPQLIIDTAWKEWKLIMPDRDSELSKHRKSLYSSRLSSEDCWGIKDKHGFFPSGIYKTPICNILRYHPALGVKFFVDFLNYSIDFYVNADCEYKHQISRIELRMQDGSKLKQWAAWELWAAFRGGSVTHYAIESLLMGLEKCLLEIAEHKTDISRKNLAYICDYLLKKSNNIAPASVLASVAMAYPTEIGDEFLPIFSNEEFYKWDVSRALIEGRALSPMDNEIPFAQKERHRLNTLPHRTKYFKGLAGFTIDYQFNVKELNNKLFKVFDHLRGELKEETDVVWKKMLSEIDIRNHKVGEYDEKLGGFPIIPEYDEDVTKFMNDGSEERDAHYTTLSYSGSISNAVEHKERLSYDRWREFKEYYSLEQNLNALYDRPVSLAVVGLRDLLGELNETDIQWCGEIILNTVIIILKDAYHHNYSLNHTYNLLEKGIALTSIHFALKNMIVDSEEKKGVIYFLMRYLGAPFSDPEVDKVTVYSREHLFNAVPGNFKHTWKALIKFAEYKILHPKKYHATTEEEIQELEQNEENYMIELAANEALSVDIEKVSLSSHDPFLLNRLLIATPFTSGDADYANFILHMLPHIIEDFKAEESYSYPRSRDARKIQTAEMFDIQYYITDLLLNADEELMKKVLDLLLIPIYSFDKIQRGGRRDYFDFVSQLIERVLYKFDHYISISEDPSYISHLTENFWKVWEYLHLKIKQSGKGYFTKTLLLGIGWKTDATHWTPLDSKRDFYYQACRDFGNYNTETIISIFSTIGEKLFLPTGINILAEILRKDSNEQLNLLAPSAERLIERLFYNHMAEIKKNKELINNFIWILDKMVDLGSSHAYLFRENVIVYKKDEPGT